MAKNETAAIVRCESIGLQVADSRVRFPSRQCVIVLLGKALNVHFPLMQSSLPVVLHIMARTDERYANRTHNVCFGLVRLDRPEVPGLYAGIVILKIFKLL